MRTRKWILVVVAAMVALTACAPPATEESPTEETEVTEETEATEE